MLEITQEKMKAPNTMFIRYLVEMLFSPGSAGVPPAPNCPWPAGSKSGRDARVPRLYDDHRDRNSAILESR